MGKRKIVSFWSLECCIVTENKNSWVNSQNVCISEADVKHSVHNIGIWIFHKQMTFTVSIIS